MTDLRLQATAALSRISENCRRAGWDSYGASPVTDAAFEVASILLTPPIVVPTVHGGVQLEWHRGGWDIEIEISPLGYMEAEAERADEPPAREGA